MGERRRIPLAERLWPKVEIGPQRDCWPFKGGTAKGYGVIARGGRHSQMYAHRAAWELTYGEIPEGMCVLHRCDNPICVNPDHLFLGTNAENSQDMAVKRRAPVHQHPEKYRGERNGRAKLSDAQVAEIRDLAVAGTGRRELAEQFSVSRSTIDFIVNRRTRRDVA